MPRCSVDRLDLREDEALLGRREALGRRLADQRLDLRRRLGIDRPGELREQAIGWHTRILEAVRAGSREAARSAMEGHMDATLAVLEFVIREDGLHLSPDALDDRRSVR